MTSVWGPLGWMTIHSVSSCYPDNPTHAEIALMSSWLDMFQSTITCPSCREHFEELLAGYRQRFPNYLSSRTNFMLFVFRAHNSVNNRLNKPIYVTVHDCFEVLRNNVKSRPAREYRNAYLNHIRRHWRTLQDTSGMVSLKKIGEMTKIEADYFRTRDNNFEIEIPEGSTFLPAQSMTTAAVEKSPTIFVNTRNPPRISLVGGRFRVIH